MEIDIDNDLFYARLFAAVEKKTGTKLDPETIAAVIDFSVGGPVSLRSIEAQQLYVTCELAMSPQQLKSADGLLKFEFITDGSLPFDIAHLMLTKLGNLSQNVVLGHKHTIDLRQVVEGKGPSLVELSLYSRTVFNGRRYGIYQVIPINEAPQLNQPERQSILQKWFKR